VSAEPVTSNGLLGVSSSAGDPPEGERALHPADDLQTYAEWVAIWQEEQTARERREVAEQEDAPERRYLDPEMQAAIEDAELELAEREEGGWFPLTMELQSALTLRNPRAPRQQREMASAYLRVVAYDRKIFAARPIRWRRRAPQRGRAPDRRARSPRQRRVRIRSGSRGDPPGSSGEDDPHDARRARGLARARPHRVAVRRREAVAA
jgi:hypothetical protein